MFLYLGFYEALMSHHPTSEFLYTSGHRFESPSQPFLLIYPKLIKTYDVLSSVFFFYMPRFTVKSQLVHIIMIRDVVKTGSGNTLFVR